MSAEPTSTNEEYGELRDRMTRVEVKLDLVLGQLGATHLDHETRIRTLEHAADPVGVDHEARIRKLERLVWIVAGVAGAGGGSFGAWLSGVLGG